MSRPQKPVKRELLDYFGITKGFFQFPELGRKVRSISEDLMDNLMVIIGGKWGSGKSNLEYFVRERLTENPDQAPKFVQVYNPEHKAMTMASILSSIIMDLRRSEIDEPIRRDIEARARQAVRLIGEAGRQVILRMDNAQDLNAHTIRALKNFKEFLYAGKQIRLSVLLVGQEDLLYKANSIGEVKCRRVEYALDERHGWMTFEQRIEFLKSVYGEIVTASARRKIAQRMDTMLALEDYTERLMEKQMIAGYKIVDEACIEMEPGELYELLEKEEHIGYRNLAKVAGISPAAISEAMNNPGSKNRSKIMASLEHIEQERANKNEPRIGKMAAAGRD
jgi:type II secretory pathway predicted ATPase ExeA